MNVHKILAILFYCVMACAVLLPMANADAQDQLTKFTFSQPVEIPGQVLPAGTYWFSLVRDDSDRNIVQIFSADWSKIYATVLTINAERPEATGETEIKFAERPHDKPEALLKWYYPGRLIGHEFLYSNRHEKEFSRDAKQDVLALPVTLASNAFPNRP